MYLIKYLIAVLFAFLTFIHSVNAQQKQGAVLGGYGELHFNDPTSGIPEEKSAGELDFHRFILYAGYNFNEKWSFNSEIELEHTLIEVEDEGEAEGGEIAIEQAHLTYRFSNAFHARGGILLVPLGIVNPVHEPPTFNGVERPNVEKFIIPSTWRESGAGFMGKLQNGLSYEAYIMAGMDPGGITGDEGIREARQSAAESSTDNLGFATRIDYQANLHLKFGVGYFFSDLESDKTFTEGELSGVKLNMIETHAIYQRSGFEARGLFAFSTISNAEKLNQVFDSGAGESQFGSYVELSYDILPFFTSTEHQLDVFGRFEAYDTNLEPAAGLTHNEAFERREYTLGLTYKPAQNVAVKFDYQFLNSKGSREVQQLNLGIGYNF